MYNKVTYATDATTDECGDAATSYYKEFVYNGKRVIVSNNVKTCCRIDPTQMFTDVVRFRTTLQSKTLSPQTQTSAALAGSLFSLRLVNPPSLVFDFILNNIFSLCSFSVSFPSKSCFVVILFSFTLSHIFLLL